MAEGVAEYRNPGKGTCRCDLSRVLPKGLSSNSEKFDLERIFHRQAAFTGVFGVFVPAC